METSPSAIDSTWFSEALEDNTPSRGTLKKLERRAKQLSVVRSSARAAQATSVALANFNEEDDMDIPNDIKP
ncbi:hypothetical protein KCU93_g8877, partial [Aureobasidium melanogenum]